MKVKSSLEDVYKAVGVEDVNDLEWPSEYASEQAYQFLKEWAANEEVDEDLPEEVREAVQDKVWERVSREVFERSMESLGAAVMGSAEEAERAANAANAVLDLSIDKGIVTIEIAEPFLKIWAVETDGMGIVAWDPDLRLKDIDSAVMVINILDNMAEVYGERDLETRYGNSFSGDGRWEPDTGSYSELAEVAEEAMKEAA